MQVQEPTFWLLQGRSRWRVDKPAASEINNNPTWAKGISQGDALQLSDDLSGPLGLISPDGSLGRLVLPTGMALDDSGIVYLLTPSGHIKRYDPENEAFVRLPSIGGRGQEARQFNNPTNIAIWGYMLFVVDAGNRRVQIFDTGTLGLIESLTRPNQWHPIDIAVHDNHAYILDGQGGCVYSFLPQTGRLHIVLQDDNFAGVWSRIAVDRSGYIYLFDHTAGRLHHYNSNGIPDGTYDYAGDVRPYFDAPPIIVDYKNRFCLPASLAHECDRHLPQDPPIFSMTVARCETGDQIFNRSGKRINKIDPTEFPGPYLYVTEGVWYSQRLDSAIYRCQWHRIELELRQTLPPGTRLRVSTLTDPNPRRSVDIRNLPEDVWDTHYDVIGRSPTTSTQDTTLHEFLVNSREGRYLWVRVQLMGGGYRTPAIKRLRIHFPRESYLQYLPAIYAHDDESRHFLEHYLGVIQTEWDALQGSIDNIAGLFDPHTVPEHYLDDLAGWLGLTLERSWTTEQKRRLLAAAPAIYDKRGTAAGLRAYLQVYLHNITDIPPEEQGDYPQIIEGFRERQRVILGRSGVGQPTVSLWGAAQVGRLQLDEFSREGDVLLHSVGDPEMDIFNEYAHRFFVMVPATWIRSNDDLEMLHRAIEAEKPVHTQYQLCLAKPHVQVGLQSTVGFDTIIGDYSVAILANLKGDAPPSATQTILGQDSILASDPSDDSDRRILPGKTLR